VYALPIPGIRRPPSSSSSTSARKSGLKAKQQTGALQSNEFCAASATSFSFARAISAFFSTGGKVEAKEFPRNDGAVHLLDRGPKFSLLRVLLGER
jgi:hypothetical protein